MVSNEVVLLANAILKLRFSDYFNDEELRHAIDRIEALISILEPDKKQYPKLFAVVGDDCRKRLARFILSKLISVARLFNAEPLYGLLAKSFSRNEPGNVADGSLHRLEYAVYGLISLGKEQYPREKYVAQVVRVRKLLDLVNANIHAEILH